MVIIFFHISIAKLVGDGFWFYSWYFFFFFFFSLLSAETFSAESQPRAGFLQSSFKSLDVSVFVMEMLT